MATEAQIKANRENAKKSTGPRTAEGKRTAAQNALKHGLFGREKTIHGESNEEYDRHREAFLDELKPATMAESVLAERIVTLSWRLKRAERMENQVTDVLIIRCGGEWPDMDMVLAIPHEVRREMVDATTLGRDMCLGQAAVRDFSYFRVIEKVTLYARRMENNLIKTMKELKRLQLERQAETQRVAATERTAVSEGCPERSRMGGDVAQDKADAPHPLQSLRSFSGCHSAAQADTNVGELKKQTQKPACDRKPEARNSKLVPSEAEGSETGEARDQGGELKKRTQSLEGKGCARAFATRDYDDASGALPAPSSA